MTPFVRVVIWLVIWALALYIVWLYRANLGRAARVGAALILSLLVFGVARGTWPDVEPSLVQGPNSIAQIGNNNQATINNAPPPWTLSSEQKALVVEAVRKNVGLWDGKSDVIMAAFGDAESERMAMGFVEAFREGGWNLPHGGFARGVYKSPPPDMHLWISAKGPSDPEVMRFAEDFSAALVKGGVVKAPLVVESVQVFDGRFQLRIGRRPDAQEVAR